MSPWEWMRIEELREAERLYLSAKAGRLAKCRQFLTVKNYDRVDWFNLWLDYLQLRERYNNDFK